MGHYFPKHSKDGVLRVTPPWTLLFDVAEASLVLSSSPITGGVGRLVCLKGLC